ncbi:hypothetical protein Dda_8122 [Drechslerella dactyloides]|uniref:Uncharacterized protein n=1 Tax=Drechslerella dactyloides TaxID=74499 RepID=A0AAD6IRJ7_DREDA|nr:hypothetical protein Dda_8122 [Drechslerella dactyloides]
MEAKLSDYNNVNGEKSVSIGRKTAIAKASCPDERAAVGKASRRERLELADRKGGRRSNGKHPGSGRDARDDGTDTSD